MKLAILGATGKTGGALLRQALEAGHTVTALVRHPGALQITNPRLTVVQGDATNVAELASAIAGVDAVLAAVGPRGLGQTTLRTDIARALVAAMAQARVRRLVWLSAIGVNDSLAQAKASSVVMGLFIKLVLKKTYVDVAAAEDVLRASSLDYVIVRPPGLTNRPRRGDVRVIPLDQKVPRMQIPRADVAAFMLEQAQVTRHVRQAATIC